MFWVCGCEGVLVCSGCVGVLVCSGVRVYWCVLGVETYTEELCCRLFCGLVVVGGVIELTGCSNERQHTIDLVLMSCTCIERCVVRMY